MYLMPSLALVYFLYTKPSVASGTRLIHSRPTPSRQFAIRAKSVGDTLSLRLLVDLGAISLYQVSPGLFED